MQDENLNEDMQNGMSVEDLFLSVQESYQEAQNRAIEENKTFAKTEFFRMDKLGVYRLRILPVAPNTNGTTDRKAYEYPVHQMLLELEKPTSGTKVQSVYVSVPRTTDAGYSVDIIDTYRKLAVASAKEKDNEKLADKISGGAFGGGLKYGYGHALYVYDLDERAKGLQLLTLSHSQFKDLDERKFKLWQKKLAKNPDYPCPISSVYNAYPIEIEKKKNGNKTEYLINIDNESDTDVLSKEELTALLNAPRIPEIIYRYTRYQFEATVEFLKQCDKNYNLTVLTNDEMREAIETLQNELSKEDTSSFTFDKRTKDSKENTDNNAISLDELFEYFDELQDKDLNDKTEEGQELRALIRAFIEQEKLSIRVTRSTTNQDLLDLIEEAVQGCPQPEEETEAKQPAETTAEPVEETPAPEETTGRPEPRTRQRRR